MKVLTFFSNTLVVILGRTVVDKINLNFFSNNVYSSFKMR